MADARTIPAIVSSIPRQIDKDGWPHSITVSEGYTSWGAYSGPVVEIIFFLAGAVASELVSMAVQTVFDQVSQKSAKDEDAGDRPRSALSRSEAIEFAKWFLVHKYSAAAQGRLEALSDFDESLKLVSEVHDIEGRLWTISFRDTHNAMYRITLSDRTGLPLPTKVERITQTD